MKQSMIRILLVLCIAAAVLVLGLLIFGLVSAESMPAHTEPTTLQSPMQTMLTPPPESSVVPQTSSVPEITQPVLESNPYCAEDFLRNGEKMECLAAPYQLGVDVSSYQGVIDWQKVAQSGISFAMIRVGGRGYGQAGKLFADEMAQVNYAAAKAAGLQVGAYFFSQAISVEEAQTEAAFVLEQIKDWDTELPVAFDWEYISEAARTANTNSQIVTACAAAFAACMENSGRTAMLYIRPEQMRLELETVAQYPRWVALYSDTMDYPYRFSMWQYTNTGKVPGIQGNVDIDLYLN